MNPELTALLGSGWVALIGAGVSRNPPTCLPVVSEILHTLVEELALRCGISLDCGTAGAVCRRVRWEVATHLLLRALGGSSDAVEKLYVALFSTAQTNSIHEALAQQLRHGCTLVTTNFDRCIEVAAESSHIGHKVLIPRTRAKLSGNGEARILKVHGCLSQPRTIIASVEQAGAGLAGKGKVIDSFVEAVRSNSLVMIGYGGRDDFDINPILLNPISQLRLVVYVDHRPNAKGIERWRIDSSRDLPTHLPPILRQLYDYGVEVVVWSGETHDIVVGRPNRKTLGSQSGKVRRTIRAWLAALPGGVDASGRHSSIVILGLLLTQAGLLSEAESAYSKYLAAEYRTEERCQVYLLRGRIRKAGGELPRAMRDLACSMQTRDTALRVAAARALLFSDLDLNHRPTVEGKEAVAYLLRVFREGRHNVKSPLVAHVARDLAWYYLKNEQPCRALYMGEFSVSRFRGMAKRRPDLRRQLGWSLRDLSWIHRHYAISLAQSGGGRREISDRFALARQALSASIAEFSSVGDTWNVAQSLRDRSILAHEAAKWNDRISRIRRHSVRAGKDLLQSLVLLSTLGARQYFFVSHKSIAGTIEAIVSSAPNEVQERLRYHLATCAQGPQRVSRPDEDLGAPGDLDSLENFNG